MSNIAENEACRQEQMRRGVLERRDFDGKQYRLRSRRFKDGDFTDGVKSLRIPWDDVAQELFQRHLFHSSPKTYYATRRMLAAYYQRSLEHLQTINTYRLSSEALEVALALASQLLFLPDEDSHIHALSPLFDILSYHDKNIEQVHTLLRMLRSTVQHLENAQVGAHAHQVVQVLLHFTELFPIQHNYDQKHKQEWFRAADDLLKLIKHTCSPSSELLAKVYCQCGWGYLWPRLSTLRLQPRYLNAGPTRGKMICSIEV